MYEQRDVYEQYELIATEYAATFHDEFARRPSDRQVLVSFTELVGGGRALDVGCGPGQATAELDACGLRAEGLDGSAAMISIARERHPSLTFCVADMRELPYPDKIFDAVCAWYSIIHTPAVELSGLFIEFARILTDSGWLLLAFQTGAPTLAFSEAFGRAVDMEFLRHEIADVHAALEGAGFTVHTTTTRARLPEVGETADQTFVIARRSG